MMDGLWARGDEMTVHLGMGGVALLLVILLLLTPVLENTSMPIGGSLVTSAQLEVDTGTNGSLLFYVLSNGHVRFTTISVGVNLSLPSQDLGSASGIHWTQWYNWSNRITTMFTLANVTQFAVNVTASYYQAGTTSPEYLSWGVYGFQLSGPGGSGTLTAYPLSAGLPATSSQTWSLSALPQTMVLAEKTVPSPSA